MMPTKTEFANSSLEPIRHRTKTQTISASLTELAHSLGPDARLPTMQQLCESLGVSIVTLNRSLSELEGQNIIERKHGVGIFVSTRLNQRTVGLVYDRDIFASGASPFCGLLVEAARARAQSIEENFSFYLATLSKNGLPVHDDLVEDLRARRLDGIVFVGESNPGAARWVEEQDVPLVALSYLPITKYRVCIDWSESVRLGVSALAKKGCRKIGLWIPLGVGLGRSGNAQTFPEREAFQTALKTHRLSFAENLIWRDTMLDGSTPAPDGATNQEQGFRAAHEVLSDEDKQNNAPDGIVILDDMMARGAIINLQQLQLQIGRDIQIATHANRGSQVLAPFAGDVSLLEIDPQEIADALFGMLETLMNGAKPKQAIAAIKPRLVGR